MTLLLAALFINILLFAYQYRKERRGLLVAFFLMTTLLSLIFLVGYIAVKSPGTLFSQISLAIGALSLISLLFFPVVLVMGLFFSAIQMIRKEGHRLPQLLSLGLGLLYLAYLIVWPQLNQAFDNPWFSFLYLYASLCFTFTAGIFTLYSISNVLNQVRRYKRHYRYILVLGSGLKKGQEVTPLLASRINKGISALQANPGSTLILSGGQGGDEELAEGEAMRYYALDQGVPEELILVENRSRNTKENLLFSKALIDAREEGHILLVTNRYHLLRALLLARDLGIPCDGQGAPTKLYFSVNAFIREWVAYVVIRRKIFITVLAAGFLLLLLRTILLRT